MIHEPRQKSGRDPGSGRGLPLIDVSTVLVVGVWLCIWLLLPLSGQAKPRSRVQTSARIGYLSGGPAAPWYLEPDWFARTTRPGFGMPDVTAAMGSAVPERAVAETPRFVEGGMNMATPGAGEMPESTNSAIHVRVTATRAFAPLQSPPPVVVTMSPELSSGGFALPPFTNDLASLPAEAWQVVAHVDVGGEGRPENVLIELGCGDPRVNATIARWLHRGVAGATGTPVSGRVTVSGTGSRR